MRQSRSNLCLLFIVSLFIAACDSSTANEEDSTGLEVGQFEFSVGGYFSAQASGNATYYEDPLWSSNGYTTFTLRGDGDEHLVTLTRYETNQLSPGEYRISSIDSTGFLAPNEFDVGYFQYPGETIVPDSQSGTITIYQVEDERMEGRFEFAVDAYYLRDPNERVSYTVSGAFNASQFYINTN